MARRKPAEIAPVQCPLPPYTRKSEIWFTTILFLLLQSLYYFAMITTEKIVTQEYTRSLFTVSQIYEEKTYGN